MNDPWDDARSSESCLVPAMMPFLIESLGASSDAVLRASGLAADRLSALPTAFTPSEFFALWTALESQVESSGNGPIPLRIVELASLEFFDPLIFAFLTSANVKAGINRIAHYKCVTSAAQVSVTDTAEGIAMDYSWPPPYRAPFALPLATQALGLWLIRLATKVNVQPLRVISPELPTDMDPYRDFFGVPVTLGRTHRMELRSIDAHRPLRTANPVLWQGFEPSLRKRLADIEDTATAREHVRAALIELLPAGDDSIEAVARRLCVSVRTLQRHLQAEEVSFQSILMETREKLAVHYLRQGTITTSEIAFLLGYKDVTSFNRAFRSWTGMSPKEARAELVA